MVNADAGVNSNGDDLAEALAGGRLTRGELVRSAANICRFLLTLPVWPHSLGQETDLDLALARSLSEEELSMQRVIPVVTETCETAIDASLIHCVRGETSVFAVTTPKRGLFRLELEARAVNQPPMAQLPFSVFKDKDLIRSVTLTGADTDWTPVSVELPPTYITNFFLKLYFAQSGLELRHVRLILAEDMEDQIREAMQAARASDRGNSN